MIRLLETPEDWYGRLSDPLLVRMAGILSAYGCGYPFALFWQQTDGIGNTVAWICSLDGHLTLSALDTANRDEIRAFLRVVGGKSLTCTPDMAAGLALPVNETVTAMVRHCLRKDGRVIPTVSELTPVLRILRSGGDGDLELPDAAAFYADLSHRIRHHAARAVLVWDEKGAPVATAVTSAEAGNAALVSGVAALPRVRGQGYGIRVMERLLDSLSGENRNVFVLCRPSRLAFYRRLGFSEFGPIAICDIEE